MWLCLVEHKLPPPSLFTIFHTQTDTHMQKDNIPTLTRMLTISILIQLRPRLFSNLAYMNSVTSAVLIKHMFLDVVCVLLKQFFFNLQVSLQMIQRIILYFFSLITFWVMLILRFLLDEVLVLPTQFLSDSYLTLPLL